VYTQPRLPGPGQELTHCALTHTAGILLSVTADHNLLLYEACSLQLQKQVSTYPFPAQDWGHSLPFTQALALTFLPPQFAGYSEEVLDVRFLGPKDSHIVVASNSPCLKVFELQTSACQILHGHTGK
jgi:U3 small nucleolar RNA-associated protein 13